jgi:hypothetical protein
MPAPRCSDAEFVELFRTHQSPTKVAEILGVHVRNALQRRRRIEERHKAKLEASSPRARHYKHLHPVEHTARRHVEISDGTVIVFSDAHFWPGVRTTAFRALTRLIGDLDPKVVVCNGDAFDGASISRYPRIGWDSKPSVVEELKACEAALGEVEEVAKGAKLFWPLGNHDARFENRLAANAAEFEGVKGFTLKEHFPAWAPCWSVWLNADVVIKHRYKGGINAPRANTLNAGRSMVTGHLHSLKVSPLSDYNGARFGVDTGTLADPSGPQFIDYLEDGPTDWRSGFAVLTFHKGRLLWPELVHAFEEGKVEFRGQVIEV